MIYFVHSWKYSRAVLNDKFRFIDGVPTNKAMLLGTILHQVFQKVNMKH